MPYLHVLPDDKQIEAAAAETILHASLRAGVPHTHVCRGHARCSTCRVSIVEGVEHCAPRNPAEQAMAERLGFSPELRLACQTTLTGDVQLRRLVLDEEDAALVNQLQPGADAGSVGEERRVAILFADIRGFTPFAEALPAYDVVHALNRYFHRVGDVIHRWGGCIDNYVGDGLMALFGAEEADDAAWRAVRAGLGMLDAVEQLQPYLRAAYGRGFDIGVGIHCGEAVVGAVGAPGGRRRTAIGDAVNFASRVEAANKGAGTRLLISEETYRQVEGRVRVGRPVRVSLPGKSGQYTLYEVVAADEAASAEGP
jgi:adenylate cyclase